ncbi:transposase [Streptomyces sp. NPDC046988]|uniref:IS110 family transposase n=1 Tax=Streptomyces sp. NPDC046988 TaxID=3154922 RepID=UPI0033FD7D9D
MTPEVVEDIADQDVFGGVDSHADTIHVAVISNNGGHLADAEFTTTAAGYAAALAFLDAHGHVIAIGVEGTSSYGAGFTRAARSHGHPVVEVNRPDRAERRRIGKSDPIDAYAAARAALSGRASSAPKDDTVAGIRALHNAARSAVKARTAALNQITHLLFTAPENIRAKYGRLKGAARTAAQFLVTAGGNPDRMRTEASFAALCGAAPVPASSGRTNRHRLSRGGDRAANAALYASLSPACPATPAPATTLPGRPQPDEPRRRSSDC